jgi:glycogen synthase
MRILHVTDSFLPRMGGIERQVDSLSRRQALRGDDVTVACTVASQGPDPDEDARTIRRPAGWSGTQVAYHRGPGIIRDIDFRGVDLVHAHVSIVSPLAALALRRAARQGVPVVATVHSLWTPRAGAALGLARNAGLLGDRRTVWSSVSRVAADAVTRHLGTTVDVLPNGVQSAYWVAPRPPVPPRTLRVATVMRLVGRKRPLPFIAMMAALRDQLPPGHELRVNVVDGPQRPAVAAAVRRAGLQSVVNLYGRLPSSGIRDVFADSDVYVAPARNESFGIAALEAHCAGLPVVALASSGVADIVSGDGSGRLVDDEAGIVAALTQLALRPVAGGTTGVGECQFDWTAVLARTDEVYERARRFADRPERSDQPVSR